MYIKGRLDDSKLSVDVLRNSVFCGNKYGEAESIQSMMSAN
jgi:hypothetical protein